MKMLNIGCHLSTSYGFLGMGQRIVQLGGNVFQFFTRNPRGGNAKPIDKTDTDNLMNFIKENNMGKILAHAPYTINPCSADPKVRDFAKRTMADDLDRMSYTPGNMYNFHPGSHVGQGVEVGIGYICGLLNEVLKPEQTTTVLLETMAGKGSEIGGTFQELRQIIDNVELSNKLGVCLDTCHIHDGGYDIVGNLDSVLEEFDNVIGLERLKALHINDSMNPTGSHKDRHQCIGQGYIGLDAFARIINHEKLRNLPMYLETPNDEDGYAKEIALLQSLYND